MCMKIIKRTLITIITLAAVLQGAYLYLYHLGYKPQIDASPSVKVDRSSDGMHSFGAQSTKYTALYRAIDGQKFPYYLLKEHYKSHIVFGIEGTNPELVLELWGYNHDGTSHRIWHFASTANKYDFSGRDELVLIEYGCCDAPDIYQYINLHTGALLRTEKKSKYQEGDT